MPRWPANPANRPGPARGDRVRAERHGRRAEALAAFYLRLKGYAILEERYRTPVGEIDLVVRDRGAIVFVEVKARRSAAHETDALLAVNAGRIGRAAQYFVSRHPALAGADMRFDVIFLAPMRWPRHVRNAFALS